MPGLFAPLTEFVNGTYFADEAAYAYAFTRLGQSPFPAKKTPGAPTKTWVANAAAAYHDDNGTQKPGFLILAEGRSVVVVDKAGQIDHLSYTTPIVPFEAARFMSPMQQQFYVRYREHEFFRAGFPFLQVAPYAADQAWLNDVNYATGSGVLAPPVSVPGNMAMRWRPGASGRGLADVEVFDIEQFFREYKPPVPGVVQTLPFTFTEEQLVDQVFALLMSGRTKAAIGADIRTLASKRG